MKRRHLILFLFILLLQTKAMKSFAGDSLFSFKVAVGAGYTVLRPHYDIALENSASHYSSLTQTVTYKDTASFSPVIKAYAGLRVKKFLNLCFNLNYGYGKLNYKSYYSYYDAEYNTDPPYWHSTYWKRQTQHFDVTAHTIVVSFGAEFHGKHLYVEPKINLHTFIFSSAVTDTTYLVTSDTRLSPDFVTETTYTHEHKRQSSLNLGAGLIVGYGFTIQKIPLFVELQADYNNRVAYSYAQKDDRSAYNNGIIPSHAIQLASFASSLAIGFKF